MLYNPLPRERFDYPGRIADEKKRSLARRNGRASERSDRAPGMVRRNVEARFSPLAQGRNPGWNTDEAKIQLAATYRRLTRITFGPKLQHHAVTESCRQRQVSLERDPFLVLRGSHPQPATVELRPSPATSTETGTAVRGNAMVVRGSAA